MEHNLDPNLWGNLPQSMMEAIVCKLPFAKVIALRLVCKAWDRLILSMQRAPPNPNPKQLLIFTQPGGGLDFISCNLKENALQEWFPSSLTSLLQPTGGLCLVAGGVGLLCFCTKNAGRLLLWNPVSKMCRQLPQAHSKDGVDPQDLLKSCHHSYNPTNMIDTTMAIHATSLGHVMVTLVTHTDAMSFKIYIACDIENNQTLQVFDSLTSSWKMLISSQVDDKLRLKFECAMVVSKKHLYFIVDGEIMSTISGQRLWNIVKINTLNDHISPMISPPENVLREQQLHTIQKPQLVVHNDNLWLIVEGLMNWTFCFYELKLGGDDLVEGQGNSEWIFLKQITRDLFAGTMVVLHQCIALKELVYFRVFDIIADGTAHLVMLVYDVSANSWCFLNDPRGLDGRYFLYHTFVFEPSLDVLI